MHKKNTMNNKISLLINSHSSNIDCLKIFLKCLETYIGIDYFRSIYLLIDKSNNIMPEYITEINYDPATSFKDQICLGLSSIKDPIILYCNEDYLFYSEPKFDILNNLITELVNSDLSFIKFVHTVLEEYSLYKENLFLIDKNCENNFSQTLSIWKTKDLLKICSMCPSSEIGVKGDYYGHLEVFAKKICKDLNIRGACYYNNEPIRGKLEYYDTEVLPHIASAIIRGRWHISEYPELVKILEENNIDLSLRGII